MSKLSSAAKAELRNQKLGFILPVPPFTAGLYRAGKRSDAAADRQEKPAEITRARTGYAESRDTDHRASHRPSELSGGERQRGHRSCAGITRVWSRG